MVLEMKKAMIALVSLYASLAPSLVQAESAESFTNQCIERSIERGQYDSNQELFCQCAGANRHRFSSPNTIAKYCFNKVEKPYWDRRRKQVEDKMLRIYEKQHNDMLTRPNPYFNFAW